MNDLKNYLLNNINLTKDITGELICRYGCLTHLEYHYMEDFNDVLEGYTPTEIINKTLHGKFNPKDNYFRFNGDNLESFNDSKLDMEYKKYINEIVENLIQHKDGINIADLRLNYLLGSIN